LLDFLLCGLLTLFLLPVRFVLPVILPRLFLLLFLFCLAFL
jgi:hypothetical protein